MVLLGVFGSFPGGGATPIVGMIDDVILALATFSAVPFARFVDVA
jgi:hypothetical protein